MPASWPASLPQSSERAGFQIEMGDGLVRSTTDAGPGKVRRRSSAVARPLAVVMQMSGAQLDDFDTFITATVAGGALPFTFPNPRGGEALLVRLGAQMPSWQEMSADRWEVSMHLEILL